MLSYRRAHKLYLKDISSGRDIFHSGQREKQELRYIREQRSGKDFIDHGSGVIIGGDGDRWGQCYSVSGCDTRRYRKETGKRHPTIGDNVMISAGAKIIGSFTVGEKFQDRSGKCGHRGSAAKLYRSWCSGKNRKT